VEVGPRDLEAGTCIVARRDTGDKQTLTLDSGTAQILVDLLEQIQKDMYQRALDFRNANTHRVDTWDEFEKAFEGEGGGGFVLAHWDGTTETEEAIADKTKATIRCILLDPLHPDDEKPGTCVFSGKPSTRRVVFAKAY
jgi:prolyl-tRNA synthetase